MDFLSYLELSLLEIYFGVFVVFIASIIRGFNDLIVYSIQATASLSAGVFLTLTSWKTMNLVCIIFLVLIILSTLRADIKERK